MGSTVFLDTVLAMPVRRSTVSSLDQEDWRRTALAVALTAGVHLVIAIAYLSYPLQRNPSPPPLPTIEVELVAATQLPVASPPPPPPPRPTPAPPKSTLAPPPKPAVTAPVATTTEPAELAIPPPLPAEPIQAPPTVAEPKLASAPILETPPEPSVAPNRPPPAAVAPSALAEEQVPPSFHADYRHNPRPDYPVLAKRRRLEGTTMLRVTVDNDGRPSEIEIAQSSGARILDDAAIQTVRNWRFAPARQGNKAVVGVVQVPIRFSLSGQ